VKSPWPANDTVWAHLLVPRSAAGRRAPAVLILPVMAAPNVWIETRFARHFARDGLAVMWVEMPTQFHRRPDPSEPSGQVFLARTPARLAANFRQSVLDARRALGVLASRPEVDADRIGVFGISLGAIVGSVLYSLDARPRFGVFLLGGSDFPSLAVDSSLTGPFVRKMGMKAGDLRGAWAGLEPDAPKAGKPALLVNARWDTVIPAANARRLAEAFPEARQVWVPGGHYTAILHMVWMPAWVSARLREALGEPSR
ncbi:MAG: alpha/beta hydrolase, partial [Elusimicrobia bacterium]|nr:alpha/beta hydrolase [Elusimicrobiota bacterium]